MINTIVSYQTIYSQFLKHVHFMHAAPQEINMSTSLTLTVSFFVLYLQSFSFVSGDSNAGSLDECLKVSASEFVGSVKSTIDNVRQANSAVLQYKTKSGGDFRLSNAISDCIELLDLSADELDWTLLESQKSKGNYVKSKSKGDLSIDLRTWLSAALTNQDTCMEGFEGTNSIVKNVVIGSLNQLTSSVHNALNMVLPSTPKSKYSDGSHGSEVGASGGDHGGRKLLDGYETFPYWFKQKDRKLLQAKEVASDKVVAADGSGDYTSIKAAMADVPELSSKRFVIYIKKGVYKENIDISKKKWNIMMMGDGMDATVISGNRNYVDGWTTFSSATFAVKGKGFIARDITFENTAGPQKHQAVAFRSDSDLSVLYKCAIRGYQDTLYAHSMRQFYRECVITGTIDFIFGDATAMFQNCQIVARKGLSNQKNTVTAQGRKDPTEPTGFSFQFSNFTGESETFLGRPWKMYSRTVIMQSYLSSAIRPEGWMEWNGDFALDTLYYAEYMNYGPGGGIGKRVNWPGYHMISSKDEANKFTVAQFILGNSWLPSTGYECLWLVFNCIYEVSSVWF